MPEIVFKGKEYVYNHHLGVPYRPLIPHAEKGIGPADLASNLVIHGDNLHALKSLLPRYAGAVDLVFIDPPYNTGNEGWCYSDNVNSPIMKEWLSTNPVDGEDLLRHDKWLCMMWPRLVLLRELMSETGSLWMTLDDNEVHRARMMLDEIFGEEAFVANVVWQKNYAPKNTAQFFSEDHDHLLVVAKNRELWRPRLLERTEEMEARYSNPDNDPRGPWKPSDLSARNYYSEGSYSVLCPSGRVIETPPPGRYWTVKKEKLLELDADKRVWWGEDGNNIPSLKRFLSEVKQGRVPQTLWFYSDVGHTQDAKKTLLEMGLLKGEETTITPKPVGLIERVLEIGAGSGYMAALMAYQAAQVVTLELDPQLAQMARDNLERAGITNASVRQADGAVDSLPEGPFDAIVLSGSVAEVPARLLSQLSDRGRLLAITGQEPVMRVTLVRRKGDRFEVSYPWDVNAARLQHFEEPSTFQF